MSLIPNLELELRMNSLKVVRQVINQNSHSKSMITGHVSGSQCKIDHGLSSTFFQLIITDLTLARYDQKGNKLLRYQISFLFILITHASGPGQTQCDLENKFDLLMSGAL